MKLIVPSFVKLDGGYGFRAQEVICRTLARLPLATVRLIIEYLKKGYKIYVQFIGGSDGSGDHPIYNSKSAIQLLNNNLVIMNNSSQWRETWNCRMGGNCS